jgi:hypothetical protein
MAHIQMTDRNPSDFGVTEEIIDEELTDKELSEIDGSGCCCQEFTFTAGAPFFHDEMDGPSMQI